MTYKRIAITASEPKVNAEFDRRFGRCRDFMIMDCGNGEWETFSNPATNAMGGAGTLAAQFLIDRDVDVVISGNFGPNAYRVLNAGGIHMYKASEGKIHEVYEAFQADQLRRMTEPSRVGRHGGR